MTLETKYNLGDVVWHFNEHNGEITQLTLGQVRVEVIESPGYDGTIFDNYKKQSGRKESYMAVETGIGTGYVYYVEDLFSTKEKAIKAKEKMEQ